MVNENILDDLLFSIFHNRLCYVFIFSLVENANVNFNVILGVLYLPMAGLKSGKLEKTSPVMLIFIQNTFCVYVGCYSKIKVGYRLNNSLNQLTKRLNWVETGRITCENLQRRFKRKFQAILNYAQAWVN